MGLKMYAVSLHLSFQLMKLTFRKAWSSVDSFPSSASRNPTLEQYRSLKSLNARFNEIQQENTQLMKQNQLLSTKLDTLLYVNKPQLKLNSLTY